MSAAATAAPSSTCAAPTTDSPRLATIDGHLHVWSSAYGAYAEGKAPPPALGDDVASYDAFASLSGEHGVDGCVIVQPINYLYDHEPVARVLRANPATTRGVLLINPAVGSPEAAVAELDRVLATAPGLWRGVRFNPGLWRGDDAGGGGGDGGGGAGAFDDAVGRAVFKRCGELGLVATFMFFAGIAAHVDRLRSLVELSPSTKVLVDHLGFVRGDPQ